MPFATILRKIYCKIKKKKLLPPPTVFDANITIANPDTCRSDGCVHFSGEFIPQKKARIRWLKIFSHGAFLGKFKPGKKDIGKHLKIDIVVPISRHHDVFEFYLEYMNGSGDYLGNLELSYQTGLNKFEKELAEKSRDIAVPPPDIIFLTQGHREPEVYLRSVPRGVYKLKQVLADVGIPFESMRTILDFGCGSGRLIRGLYADDPTREIYGADYNEELITWAKQNLPQGITFIKNEFAPPLPVEDQKFDLVYLVSVFTHLPLESQYKWLSEFKRILKSNGILVISLHGMAYLYEFRRNGSESYEDLMTTGYASIYSGSDAAAGSNQFFTAHMPEYACAALFKDWNILAALPGGKLRNQLATLDILGFSGVQDIYVLSP
jgi:SAM-dependent methyltransferase